MKGKRRRLRGIDPGTDVAAIKAVGAILNAKTKTFPQGMGSASADELAVAKSRMRRRKR